MPLANAGQGSDPALGPSPGESPSDSGPAARRGSPPVVLLIGPPGSGKGTQARMIESALHIPAIATGELLRGEVAAGTELGSRVSSVLNRGELAADDTVNQMVSRRLSQPDTARGFVLDGYPRTIPQARFLDRLLSGKGFPKLIALHLAVPDEVVVQRLLGRERLDDTPEAIGERLKAYREQTRPLLAHYAGAGYHEIDALRSPEDVYRQIEAVLRPRFALR